MAAHNDPLNRAAINLSLPADLLRRVDALADRLAADGRGCTRSAAMRVALTRGLLALGVPIPRDDESSR